MTEERLPLADLLAKAGDGDFLRSLAEAVLQLRGEAGERQLDGVETALVHGINGMCGQSHCVWVLGK